MRAASSLDEVGVLGRKQTPLIVEPNTPCRSLLSGWSGGHQSAKLQSQIVAPSLSLEPGARSRLGSGPCRDFGETNKQCCPCPTPPDLDIGCGWGEG